MKIGQNCLGVDRIKFFSNIDLICNFNIKIILTRLSGWNFENIRNFLQEKFFLKTRYYITYNIIRKLRLRKRGELQINIRKRNILEII